MPIEISPEEFKKLPYESESAKLERKVKEFLEKTRGLKLHKARLEIGLGDNGAIQMHEFDLVSEDKTVVGECKCYKWTENGNYPSGKISTANEALFYLSRVNAKEKFLVLAEDLSLKHESLPDVYVRRSSGLMDDVEVYKYVYGTSP
jgi:hypothetical protein